MPPLILPVGGGTRLATPAVKIQKLPEGARIADLAMCNYFDPDFVRVAREWAAASWRRPTATMDFLDVQAVVLLVAYLTGGVLVQAGVGKGKTLLSFLLADALGASNPILFHPASVRTKTEREWHEYNEHFRLPRNLRRMAYEELSTAANTDVLDRLKPDCLVLDEAHKLRRLSAARTKRVDRYMDAYPGVKVAAMSGTLTSTSILDYEHFARWALKKQAPVPLEGGALQSFQVILDVRPTEADSASGEVEFRSVYSPGEQHWRDFEYLYPARDTVPREHQQAEARKAWSRRLSSAPGVIVTTDPSCSAALYFRERRVAVPEVVERAMQKLEETWTRDDEEELSDAKDFYRVASQMSQGFYYRWVWPDGVKDFEWLEARSAWHSAIHSICKRSIPGCDSAFLVGQAVHRGTIHQLCPMEAAATIAAREQWRTQEHKRWDGLPHPPTETIWLDDFLVDDAVAWHKEYPKGLIWYEHGAIAQALAARGIPVYGAGTTPPMSGKHGMALSIRAHGTGKNLQAHHENLFVSFPSSGEQCEQLIGRTHRQGQMADEVWVDWYGHTGVARRAVSQAQTKALYMRDSTSTPQKLLDGMWL